MSENINIKKEILDKDVIKITFNFSKNIDKAIDFCSIKRTPYKEYKSDFLEKRQRRRIATWLMPLLNNNEKILYDEEFLRIRCFNVINRRQEDISPIIGYLKSAIAKTLSAYKKHKEKRGLKNG